MHNKASTVAVLRTEGEKERESTRAIYTENIWKYWFCFPFVSCLVFHVSPLIWIETVKKEYYLCWRRWFRDIRWTWPHSMRLAQLWSWDWGSSALSTGKRETREAGKPGGKDTHVLLVTVPNWYWPQWRAFGNIFWDPFWPSASTQERTLPILHLCF